MIYRFTEVLNDLVNYFLLGDILLLEDWKQANHLSDDLAMEFTTNESGDRVFDEGIVIPMTGIENYIIPISSRMKPICSSHLMKSIIRLWQIIYHLGPLFRSNVTEQIRTEIPGDRNIVRRPRVAGGIDQTGI